MQYAGTQVIVALIVLLPGVGCAQNDRASDHAESTGSNGAGATANDTGRAADVANRSAASTSGSRRVIILGTSLTAGLGLDPDEAYPALLQRKADSAGLRLEVVNAGLSGETSAGALRRVGWVLDQPAAVVVLEVGANDGLRGVDPDTTYANLRSIIAEAQRLRPEAKVLLVQMEAPTNLGPGYTSRFHSAFVRAASESGVELLPFLLEGVAGEARLNQGDGVHPNEIGSQRVAENMWRALLPTFTAAASR